MHPTSCYWERHFWKCHHRSELELYLPFFQHSVRNYAGPDRSCLNHTPQNCSKDDCILISKVHHVSVKVEARNFNFTCEKNVYFTFIERQSGREIKAINLIAIEGLEPYASDNCPERDHFAGSGKTAAFALPILEQLVHRNRRISSTTALILTPTRELAVQVAILISRQ